MGLGDVRAVGRGCVPDKGTEDAGPCWPARYHVECDVLLELLREADERALRVR